MAIISIPKPLREKLGEEGTDALVQVLNENEKELRSSLIDFAEQRFEKHLTEEIAGVRVDLAEAEKRFEKRLIEEISSVRLDLTSAEKRLIKEISSVRLDLTSAEKRLTEEIAGLQEEMVRNDLSLRDELKADIADLRGDILKSKSDTIKWMFLFWIGQIGAVLGIILAVFK
jgi:hypothetical protein